MLRSLHCCWWERSAVAAALRGPGLARTFTVTACRASDEDWAKDPDVKKLLSDIRSDFDKEKYMTASAAEPSVRNQENSSDPTISEKSDNTVEGKNISQLLADLYGEESVTPGPKEKLSSIGGYKEYIDSDSTVIYDVDEERALLKAALEEGRELPDSRSKKLSPAAKYRHLAGRRGERGVWELHELVAVLRGERVRDLTVISVPPEKQYADYLVVGTASSGRHLRVVSSLLLSLYKKKMYSKDRVPRLEGQEDPNTGWIAIDMGNIVCHLQTQEEREYYDLELLWTVGPEYDDATRQQAGVGEGDRIDRLVQLMATEMDAEDLSIKEENSRDTQHT